MSSMFTATLAILLGQRTFMSSIGITNQLRNFGPGDHSEGHPWWIMTRNGDHYRVRYLNGMWRVFPHAPVGPADPWYHV